MAGDLAKQLVPDGLREVVQPLILEAATRRQGAGRPGTGTGRCLPRAAVPKTVLFVLTDHHGLPPVVARSVANVHGSRTLAPGERPPRCPLDLRAPASPAEMLHADKGHGCPHARRFLRS